MHMYVADHRMNGSRWALVSRGCLLRCYGNHTAIQLTINHPYKLTTTLYKSKTKLKSSSYD